MTYRNLAGEVSSVVCRTLEVQQRSAELRPETCLLELGLDSLKAVDLAVAIEEALGVSEFPIQEWADSEALREPPRFTLGSLIAICAALIDAPAEGRASGK